MDDPTSGEPDEDTGTSRLRKLVFFVVPTVVASVLMVALGMPWLVIAFVAVVFLLMAIAGS